VLGRRRARRGTNECCLMSENMQLSVARSFAVSRIEIQKGSGGRQLISANFPKSSKLLNVFREDVVVAHRRASIALVSRLLR
jgi:hypothetical protein